MKKLFYGGEEINIADDVDTDELGNEIVRALSPNDNTGPWVEFASPNGTVNTILVVPGVPIRFAEREPSESGRRSGIIA